MCGGGSSNKTTTTSGPSPAVTAAYTDVYNKASNVASQPLQQYAGPLVAGFNNDQLTGMGEVRDAQGLAQPYIAQGSTYMQSAANPLTTDKIQSLESPYTQDVVDKTQKWYDHSNKEQLQGVAGNATTRGAYGGDREAVAEAQTSEGQQLAQAPVIAGLYDKGYNQAVSAAEAQGWLQQGAGYGLGSLGQEAQTQALTGANALATTGDTQQKLEQSNLNIPYEQFTQQQAYPWQTTGWLSNIAQGIGSNSGGVSSTTTPGPSTLGTAAGIGTAGLGLYGLANNSGLFDSGTSGITSAANLSTSNGFRSGGPVEFVPQHYATGGYATTSLPSSNYGTNTSMLGSLSTGSGTGSSSTGTTGTSGTISSLADTSWNPSSSNSSSSAAPTYNTPYATPMAQMPGNIRTPNWLGVNRGGRIPHFANGGMSSIPYSSNSMLSSAIPDVSVDFIPGPSGYGGTGSTAKQPVTSTTQQTSSGGGGGILGLLGTVGGSFVGMPWLGAVGTGLDKVTGVSRGGRTGYAPGGSTAIPDAVLPTLGHDAITPATIASTRSVEDYAPQWQAKGSYPAPVLPVQRDYTAQPLSIGMTNGRMDRLDLTPGAQASAPAPAPAAPAPVDNNTAINEALFALFNGGSSGDNGGKRGGRVGFDTGGVPDLSRSYVPDADTKPQRRGIGIPAPPRPYQDDTLKDISSLATSAGKMFKNNGTDQATDRSLGGIVAPEYTYRGYAEGGGTEWNPDWATLTPQERIKSLGNIFDPSIASTDARWLDPYVQLMNPMPLVREVKKRYGYDYGGTVQQTGQGLSGGYNPMTQGLVSQYMQLPIEKLREMAMRPASSSVQTAAIQQAIRMKQANPQADATATGGGGTSAGFGAPTSAVSPALAWRGGRQGFDEGGYVSDDTRDILSSHGSDEPPHPRASAPIVSDDDYMTLGGDLAAEPQRYRRPTATRYELQPLVPNEMVMPETKLPPADLRSPPRDDNQYLSAPIDSNISLQRVHRSLGSTDEPSATTRSILGEHETKEPRPWFERARSFGSLPSGPEEGMRPWPTPTTRVNDVSDVHDLSVPPTELPPQRASAIEPDHLGAAPVRGVADVHDLSAPPAAIDARKPGSRLMQNGQPAYPPNTPINSKGQPYSPTLRNMPADQSANVDASMQAIRDAQRAGRDPYAVAPSAAAPAQPTSGLGAAPATTRPSGGDLGPPPAARQTSPAPYLGEHGDPRNMAPVIRDAAARYGVDPNTMLRVAQKEGLTIFRGDNGTSGGAMQLHVTPNDSGAVGDLYRRETGKDPLDPKNEADTIDFAAKYASQHGWGAWTGAKLAGVGQWDGIGGRPSGGPDVGIGGGKPPDQIIGAGGDGSGLGEPPRPSLRNDDLSSLYNRKPGIGASPWLPVIAAGLGMMASRSPHAGVAIGEGGLAGVKLAESQESQANKDQLAQIRGQAVENQARNLAELANYRDRMVDYRQTHGSDLIAAKAEGLRAQIASLDEKARHNQATEAEAAEKRRLQDQLAQLNAAVRAKPMAGFDRDKDGNIVYGEHQFDAASGTYKFVPGAGVGRAPTTGVPDPHKFSQDVQAELKRLDGSVDPNVMKMSDEDKTKMATDNVLKRYPQTPGMQQHPATVAAPARPTAVPEGSAYSPSRKMWRDSQGNVYDAQGNPQ